MKPRLVILESPYAARSKSELRRNLDFARKCLRDSLLRGEAPMASHLLYTQPFVLDDLVAGERELGIAAGLAWGRVADATVVYRDLGITEGMRQGIRRAHDEGRPVELRLLGGRS
jgi:hypothetical protein